MQPSTGTGSGPPSQEEEAGAAPSAAGRGCSEGRRPRSRKRVWGPAGGPKARRNEAVQPQRPLQRRPQSGAAQSRIRRVFLQFLPEVQVSGPGPGGWAGRAGSRVSLRGAPPWPRAARCARGAVPSVPVIPQYRPVVERLGECSKIVRITRFATECREVGYRDPEISILTPTSHPVI